MEGTRNCTECGHSVSAQARFCERCGTGLRAGVVPLRAPEPLAEKIAEQRTAIEGERKQVTVMFTDIVRSMELTRALETERWGLILDRFLAISSRSIHEYEGTINQFTGDGLMAVFGAPVAHEDHARRACLASLRLQEALEPFARQVAHEDEVDFRIRCGLNSGEVIVGSIGDDLHMAFVPLGNTSALGKRMESIAPAGSTAMSSTTATLVQGEFELRELGEFEVKGVDEPQRVFELVGRGGARSRLEAVEAARGLSRFVGRDAEMRTLERNLHEALDGAGSTVGIVGEPGIGKSRICHEFVSRCRAAGISVDYGAAFAHGKAVPLLPVLAMLRDFFGVAEDDDPQRARRRIESVLLTLDRSLASELGLVFDFLGIRDPSDPPERIDPEAHQRRLLALVKRLVKARSLHQPGVILVEDLHWLDEASALFLEALAETVPGTRTLLVVTFRPGYEPAWSKSLNYTQIDVAPLDVDATSDLMDELLGRDPSLDQLTETIRERTAGNPFFIEEVVRALVETGDLSGAEGTYRLVRAVDDLVLPPTVEAVLAARMDRLSSRDKTVIQTMSVIGRTVPAPVLREVAVLPEPDLAASVSDLRSAGFLTQESSEGDGDLEFKHPLTQEVAYSSQLSQARRRIHSAVAEAISRVYPDGLDERAGLLAHHSEAAGEKLAAAEWHARAAAWVTSASPAEGMRHWRRVRELTDELGASEEGAGLAMISRISILALSWRLGVPPSETDEVHSEGRALIDGTRGHAIPRETRVVQQVLLDVAYGTNLVLGGRAQAGLKILRLAGTEVKSVADPGLRLATAANLAVAAWLLGYPREGLAATDTALSAAADDTGAGAGVVFGNPFAWCLWTRAACRAELGQIASAKGDYQLALRLARDHRDAECEVFMVAVRALQQEQTRILDPGWRDARKAVEIAERAGNLQALMTGLLVVAYDQLARGEPQTAAATAEKVSELMTKRRTGFEMKPDLLAIRARAASARGEVEKALHSARQAVANAADQSLKRQEVTARIALAKVLLESGIPGAGVELQSTLSRALEITEEAEARTTEPRVRMHLAAFARLRGDAAHAAREETETRRLLERFGAHPGAVDALAEDAKLPLAAARVGGTA